jgi:acyl-CoA hydrolase
MSSKRCSAADAIRLVRDGDMIIVPTGAGEPPALLTELSAQRRNFKGVQVAQILAMRKYDYFDQGTAHHVRHCALFFGGASRPAGQAGWAGFIPAYFSEIPSLIEHGQMPADVVFALASEMDQHGNFSLSLGADYTMAALQKARVIVLESNPNVPFAHGQCHIHISQVTAVVESDAPVIEVGLPKIGPVQEAIAAHVAPMIEDGSTLQIGYGGIPDAVVMQLTSKQDLGIHTEMIGDGILKLVECGAVTNRRKSFMPGRMVATFALGSRKLYDFMHHNPMLEMHPVSQPADRPAGTVRLGKPGAPALFRHRRPGGLCAGSQSFSRRQVLYRAAVDRQGRQHFAHRAHPVRRDTCDHEQERHQLRGDRIWRGTIARQVGQATRRSADFDCASRFQGRIAA